MIRKADELRDALSPDMAVVKTHREGYSITGTGAPVHGQAVNTLIRRGVLVASDDGLFPGLGQSWRLAS